MRALFVLSLAGLIAGLMLAQAPPAPTAKAVGTMSELMIDVVYPTSNAVFYIFREPPKNEVQWEIFKTQALTLAESANLLMMPSRAEHATRTSGW